MMPSTTLFAKTQHQKTNPAKLQTVKENGLLKTKQ
jgi:hypothetical protein